jgi:hypothetical protein
MDPFQMISNKALAAVRCRKSYTNEIDQPKLRCPQRNFGSLKAFLKSFVSMIGLVVSSWAAKDETLCSTGAKMQLRDTTLTMYNAPMGRSSCAKSIPVTLVGCPLRKWRSLLSVVFAILWVNKLCRVITSEAKVFIATLKMMCWI